MPCLVDICGSPEQKQTKSGLVRQRGGRGNWEDRREGKLWLGCKINKKNGTLICHALGQT